MLEIILPSSLVGLLAAFEPCFQAPSYRTFGLLVAGWIHCLVSYFAHARRVRFWEG